MRQCELSHRDDLGRERWEWRAVALKNSFPLLAPHEFSQETNIVDWFVECPSSCVSWAGGGVGKAVKEAGEE